MKKEKSGYRSGASLLWSTRAISVFFSYALIGYIQYYCSDLLGLNIAVVGTLLLLSKIIDAISNFVIANIVDNHRSKWGKGRPWEPSVVLMWLCIILMFSVPASWGDVTKYAIIFLLYTLINAVFSTFLSCIDMIYLKHAFIEENIRTKVQAVAGGIGTLAMAVGTIILPMLIAHYDNIENGWTIMTAMIGIPLALLGTIRFLTIPEVDAAETAAYEAEKVSIFETFKAFVSNKYTLMIMVMGFAVNMLNTFGASPTTYYFKYIVGDISKQSIVGMMSILCISILVVLVPLSNKFGKANVVRVALLCGVISYLLRFWVGDNIVFLAILAFVSASALMPYSVLSNLMLIDSMDFMDWRDHKRMEGAIFAGSGLGVTIGNGLGSSVSGIFLSAFGYDGAAAVQSSTALFGIKACFSIVPAVLLLIAFGLMLFYDLDKKMPQIRKDLDDI